MTDPATLAELAVARSRRVWETAALPAGRIRRNPAMTSEARQVVRRTITLKKGEERKAIGPDKAALMPQYLGLAPWVTPWITEHVDPLLAPGVDYEFEGKDLKLWVLLRGAVDGIAAYLSGDLGEDAPFEATVWKAALTQLRAEVTTLGQTPAAGGTYSLFGSTYNVAHSGHANHYYLTRQGAHEPVQYSGRLTGPAAKLMIEALAAGRRNDRVTSPGQVDEFVCAYVAESTRWTPEHIFNLIATRAGGSVTANQGTPAPMASGTTWEPALQRIGKETPRRAIEFARAMGLEWAVNEAYKTATDRPSFLSGVRINLGLENAPQ